VQHAHVLQSLGGQLASLVLRSEMIELSKMHENYVSDQSFHTRIDALPIVYAPPRLLESMQLRARRTLLKVCRCRKCARRTHLIFRLGSLCNYSLPLFVAVPPSY
jgi:hypothetical protein